MGDLNLIEIIKFVVFKFFSNLPTCYLSQVYKSINKKISPYLSDLFKLFNLINMSLTNDSIKGCKAKYVLQLMRFLE